LKNLTPHEKKVLGLISRHPEIVGDRAAREKVAQEQGISEKTLRNRIADLKRYGMIQISSKRNGVTGIVDKEEMTLFDIGRILWKRRRLIIANVIIVSSLAVFISLIIPKTFRSSVVLMPPATESSLGILGALSSLPFGGLIPKASDSETMNFLAILKSRTVMENVINEFGLIDFYGVENMEEAVEELTNDINFNIEDEGTIKVTSLVSTSWFHNEAEEIRSKKLAADMANYFVTNLDIVNKRLKTDKAKFHRLFIEERYNKNIEDLMIAEDHLKAFQEKHNMILLPEQTRAAIEAAANIKAQIIGNEVKINVLNEILIPNHPETEMLRMEIEGLQAQLQTLEVGSPNDNLFPVFSEVPDLGVQLARLIRDVEIQNTLFTFLTQQYEEAKIQESRDNPTLQVLDQAIPPERKYKPQRARIVIISFAISFILSLYLVYFIERWQAINLINS